MIKKWFLLSVWILLFFSFTQADSQIFNDENYHLMLTSDHPFPMTGKVVVNLLFVESNGQIDADEFTWTTGDEDILINKTNKALTYWSDWAQQYGSNVSFIPVIYRHDLSSMQQGYEPVRHSVSEEYLWVGEIMKNLGYQETTIPDTVLKFNQDKAQVFSADRAFSIFLIKNYIKNDGKRDKTTLTMKDGKHEFAWAYTKTFVSLLRYPGKYLLFSWEPNLLSPWELLRLLIHESGHIFGACDEYASQCNSCAICQKLPDVNIDNGNCASCNKKAIDCIMLVAKTDIFNRYYLCSYTPGQIGWPTYMKSVWTSDSQGTSKTTFSRGDEIKYNVEFAFSADSEKNVIINATISGNKENVSPYSENFFYNQKLSPGLNSISFESIVSEDASPGSNVEIDVEVKVELYTNPKREYKTYWDRLDEKVKLKKLEKEKRIIEKEIRDIEREIRDKEEKELERENKRLQEEKELNNKIMRLQLEAQATVSERSSEYRQGYVKKYLKKILDDKNSIRQDYYLQMMDKDIEIIKEKAPEIIEMWKEPLKRLELAEKLTYIILPWEEEQKENQQMVDRTKKNNEGLLEEEKNQEEKRLKKIEEFKREAKASAPKRDPGVMKRYVKENRKFLLSKENSEKVISEIKEIEGCLDFAWFKENAPEVIEMWFYQYNLWKMAMEDYGKWRYWTTEEKAEHEEKTEQIKDLLVIKGSLKRMEQRELLFNQEVKRIKNKGYDPETEKLLIEGRCQLILNYDATQIDKENNDEEPEKL